MKANWKFSKILICSVIAILLLVILTVILQKNESIPDGSVKNNTEESIALEALDPDPVLTSLEKAEISRHHCPEGMVAVLGGVIKTDWRFNDGKAIPIAGNPRKVTTFCMDIYEYPNIRHVAPKTKVNFFESKKLCELAGKRLCTEDEWELACAGEQNRRYTYGNDRQPWRCNTDGLKAGSCSGIAPAGSFPGCRNKYGVYDLNGNVSEWVDRQENNGAVLRGGTGWEAEYGQSCFSRHIHPPETDNYCDDGFRCCKNGKRIGQSAKDEF